MHLLRAILTFMFAVVATASPVLLQEPSGSLVPRSDLPPGCPDYCDCSKYKDDPEGLFQCATNANCEALGCH